MCSRIFRKIFDKNCVKCEKLKPETSTSKSTEKDVNSESMDGLKVSKAVTVRQLAVMYNIYRKPFDKIPGLPSIQSIKDPNNLLVDIESVLQYYKHKNSIKRRLRLCRPFKPQIVTELKSCGIKINNELIKELKVYAKDLRNISNNNYKIQIDDIESTFSSPTIDSDLITIRSVTPEDDIEQTLSIVEDYGIEAKMAEVTQMAGKPIDEVRKVMKEKLNVTQEDVVAYVKRQWPRIAVNLFIFVFQLLWLFFTIRDSNWKCRGFVWKLFFSMKLLVVMTILEVFRWADIPIKKFALKQSDYNRYQNNERIQIKSSSS